MGKLLMTSNRLGLGALVALGQQPEDPTMGAPSVPATTPPASPTPAPVLPPAEPPVEDLASTMVLHGAVGVLAGAAAAPRGSESLWGAAGFVVGATLGQIGLVGLLAAALYMKAGAR
jgi:hypothetical protein